VGFEPTITGSERAKTVHVLDRSATVTGKDRWYAVRYLILISFEGASIYVYTSGLVKKIPLFKTPYLDMVRSQFHQPLTFITYNVYSHLLSACFQDVLL
jgi:hypothetical protein